MRRIVFIFFLFCIVAFALSAQTTDTEEELDPIVQSFIRNFARASLQTKIQILHDSRGIENVNMGPLYEKALKFILDNRDLLKSDVMMQQLSILAVRLVGISGYKGATLQLWNLFEVYNETSARIALMNSLGEVAEGNQKIIREMNEWVSTQNSLFQAGTRPDYQVLGECITSLGKLGNSESFPIIFTTMTLQYSEEISTKAREALHAIEGDFKDMIIDVINDNPIRDKLAALQMALESNKITEEEKGVVAEKALEIGLITTPTDASQRRQLRNLRFVAINALRERKWAKATPLVIDHFNSVIAEYERGVVGKSNFLEAIACLGAMGTPEAAQRLNLYLGLLNQYKENERSVDEQIVLAVINNLGQLGDSVASDNLLYAQYLNYSSTVRNAAKEAFNNLKRS